MAVSIVEEKLTTSRSLIDTLNDAEEGSEIQSPSVRFIHVEGARSRKQLIFSGNTAGKGGDALFSNSVAVGWIGKFNCLENFKAISNLPEQNMACVISSTPSRVCLCHNSEKDCSIVTDPTTCNIYPGEAITIPVVVVGQDFGTVTGSVIAQLLVPSGLSHKRVLYLKEGQNIAQFLNGPCMSLEYTFYTNCVDCKAVLVLKTDDGKVLDIMTTETVGN